jgi:Glycosyltransferase family 87
VAALLMLHAAFSLAPAFLTHDQDFLNYYLPARARWEGRSLDRAYERLWMAREAEAAGASYVGLLAPNPPPDVLLLLPLAALRAPAAKVVWTAVLAAALAAAFVVVRRLVPAPGWQVALAFLLPSAALANALAYGQPYSILLLLLALALLALVRGREWVSGLLLAPVVVLKLYALALLPWLLWTRRWRAAAGLVAGTAAVAAASVGILGAPVHETYLREILPASLEGRLIDPYSPFWQTVPAVARRLFQFEPELNPHPVADLPRVAAFLGRFVPAAVLAASILVARRGSCEARVREEWAALLIAALAVAPVSSTYHLLLLVLPCALLIANGAGRWRGPALLALLAFATSSLPHQFTPLAHGWGNLVACPRLVALLALWALAVAPLITPAAAALAVLAGLLAGATTLARAPAPPPGERVVAARGPLISEPLECEGGLYWIGPEPLGYALEGENGTRRPADTARCVEGRTAAGSAGVASALGVTPTAALVDTDRAGTITVVADARREELRLRAGGQEHVLARGRIARPRISPDGAWIAYQQWAGGSWDVRAIERASGRVVTVAATAANDIEPSWAAGGTAVLFVSEHRRGLFGGAIYRAPFVP